MSNKLTEQDLSDIVYFWKEKEDLERWSSFEEKKAIIESERPEIIKAWNDYKAAVKIMHLVTNDLY